MCSACACVQCLCLCAAASLPLSWHACLRELRLNLSPSLSTTVPRTLNEGLTSVQHHKRQVPCSAPRTTRTRSRVRGPCTRSAWLFQGRCVWSPVFRGRRPWHEARTGGDPHTTREVAGGQLTSGVRQPYADALTGTNTHARAPRSFLSPAVRYSRGGGGTRSLCAVPVPVRVRVRPPHGASTRRPSTTNQQRAGGAGDGAGVRCRKLE